MAENKNKKKASKKKTRKKVNYLNNKDLLAEVIKSKEQGAMTNKLAHMLQTLAARYGKKGNFVNYCVDSETEALTQSGWKSYDQLSTEDIILSYDISDRTLKWSDVNGVYINENYNGPMHKLDTQGMDALVTPNHKFVSLERGIIPVENIICNEHIVLSGYPVNHTQNKIYTDSFVEVVGWAITEGHYVKGSKKKRCISISQKPGYHSEKIRTALMESNIPHKEYSSNKNLNIFNCTGEDINKIYDNIAPNRILTPAFILSLTHTQRMLLIETMINADGWYRPNGGMSYVQKCKDHVDSFLMLCTIAGLTTSTTRRVYKTPQSNVNPDGGTSEVFIINIYNEPKTHCKSERINFHGGRPNPGGRREQKQNTPTQRYQGVVWCPQTKYGTFVCRRGKYVYVTGNSYNEDMQAYAMLMLVKTWNSFDPEKSSNPFAFFTQCIKNSFIQFLNQERRQRDVRDGLLVDNGMAPSYTYQMAHESKLKAHKEIDHHDQHFQDDDTIHHFESTDEEGQF